MEESPEVLYYCPCGEYGVLAQWTFHGAIIRHKDCGDLGPVPPSQDVVEAGRH